MPLKGQAKTDYQRDYMKKRRSNKDMLDPIGPPVRPVKPTRLYPVKPEDFAEKLKVQGIALDGNRISSESEH